MKAAAWTAGFMAICIAAIVVYRAYSVPEGSVQLLTQKVCPPVVSLGPRAEGAPVDDVAGLRPGFTMQDVRLTLDCRDEGYSYRFDRLWHTPLTVSVKTRQRLVAMRPNETLSLGIVGPYEKEVVYAVFQELTIAPTTVTAPPEDMVRDLTRYYGQPHEAKSAKTTRELWWLYDPLGKPLMAPSPHQNALTAVTDWITGSWETNQCKRHAKLDPMAQQHWDAQCGLTIHASIELDKDDPTRVARFRMVLIDQARLASAVELYRTQVGAVSPTR